jgi:alanine-synthesizing transaminase
VEKTPTHMASAIKLSSRVEHVSYAIRDIVQRADKVGASGIKLHRFNIGDPNHFDFAPPACITNAIKKALDDPKYSGYAPSEGDPELREAVAGVEGVQRKDIFVTAGLSEGISFLLQSLLDPGDNVMLPAPSYPLYTTICRVLGAEENNYATDSKWHPVVDDLRKKITSRTKAILVINPNNPTGAVYPEKILKEIANVAGEHNLPIISDEIYNKLTFSSPAIPMHKVAKDVPVISGNGLSKNYIYTGARVGYVAIHAGEDLDPLRAALQKLCNARLSINWEMQRGAIAAYANPPSHIKPALDKLRPRRDLMHRRLNEIEGIEAVLPQAAFYIFPKVHSGPWANDYSFVYDVLESTGIVGVPGSGFTSGLPGKFFRLVYLAKEPEIGESMGKLEKFMKARLKKGA